MIGDPPSQEGISGKKILMNESIKKQITGVIEAHKRMIAEL